MAHSDPTSPAPPRHDTHATYNRRRWLTGALATSLAAGTSIGAEQRESSASMIESVDADSVVRDVDVLVCGGGPAGVAAALAAAATGARVQILEAHGCLGGVWTSGMLAYVIDADKPGLNHFLKKQLETFDAYQGHGMHYVYDVEAMKYLLESCADNLQIQIRLHTRVVDVVRHGRRVTGVVTESKSGRETWPARVVIDATGDGDVGALAGCDFQFGRDRDCPCQPMSLMGVISADPAVLERFSTLASQANKDALAAEIRRGGVDPSYAKATLWWLGGPIATVMLNHEYGVRPFDADAVTRATIDARRELFRIVRGLRSLGGPWSECRLVATAEQIGVRDGRRIAGRYLVTADDVIAGIRHDDAICRSTFSVDIHAATREANRKAAYHTGGIQAKPFDIPLRALVARDVDGLMMAGRCISGDFIAHASYRVTGNAVAMGEAAGVAAALAARTDRLPHTVGFPEVAQGVSAFHKRLETLVVS